MAAVRHRQVRYCLLSAVLDGVCCTYCCVAVSLCGCARHAGTPASEFTRSDARLTPSPAGVPTATYGVLAR
ncbi:hypothetical protein F4803DRAFT_517245 [Xylaria telfairii]|nr:hypothetical protein F4803DRAFT_517245 [Xylaria telfairii]